MDFFDAQARARTRSLWVVLLAFVALAIIIALVYMGGLFCWRVAERTRRHSETHEFVEVPAAGVWWLPGLFFLTTGAVVFVVGAGAAHRLFELRDGGNAIAHSLGARLVRYDTAALDERRLVNVVEELAIASGVRIPEVFVLAEESINSFCAGHSPDTAVLIVTRGAMEALARDELQAILAHEFSHILNGDMRINTFLAGVLHGFLTLSITGQKILLARSSSPVIPLAGGLLIAIGHLGRLLGSAIQALLCRQREWLADAHAVQFTRNPRAIVGALKKIGGHPDGSSVSRPHAIESAHMFFANPIDTRWSFASHPSLTRRIRAMDPRFDGVFPRLPSHPLIPPPPGATWKQVIALRKAALRRYTPPHPPGGQPVTPATTTPPSAPPDTAPATIPPHLASTATPPDLAPAAIPPGLAPTAIPPAPAPGMSAAAFAAAILDSIPGPLREAAADPALAPALFFGILMHAARDATAGQQQDNDAPAPPPGILSPGEQTRLAALQTQLAALPADAQLALADLALPALRALAPAAAAAFLKTVDALVLSDRRVSLREFALRHMARRHLSPARPGLPRDHAAGLTRPVILVLGAIAQAAGDPAAAARSFHAGLSALPPAMAMLGKTTPARPEAPPPPVLMEALRALDDASPRLKKMALAAFARAMESDKRLVADETVLLRVITIALDCPAPPPDASR